MQKNNWTQLALTPYLLLPQASQYSTQLFQRDVRLSWLWWLAIYCWDGLPFSNNSSIQVVITQQRPDQKSNLWLSDHKSDALTITRPGHYNAIVMLSIVQIQYAAYPSDAHNKVHDKTQGKSATSQSLPMTSSWRLTSNTKNRLCGNLQHSVRN